MKLHIWPPVWLTLMATLAFFTDRLLPGLRLPGAPFYLTGPILWIPALWLFWHACDRFHSAHTSTHPFTRPNVFVIRGPYTNSRNPMYVVALMVLTGWCAVLGNPATLPFVWLLKKVLYQFVIREEEKMLEEMFKGNYRDYCQRVPRWV
ncbi:isoprenylcysteine carboxylmethyltransferase family protein [Desulfoluna sp.]|uniref:methyltransferase family protein n=1 Tax=Desulfoluna sp. TaxID=2045199 RepID=UPI002639D82F|nr:isoprenylcysteine carboxylmethyltransferase family protein [Desulfoluna sp.]